MRIINNIVCVHTAELTHLPVVVYSHCVHFYLGVRSVTQKDGPLWFSISLIVLYVSHLFVSDMDRFRHSLEQYAAPSFTTIYQTQGPGTKLCVHCQVI